MQKVMRKFITTVILVVAVSMFVTTAYARDRIYEADVVVIGVGGSGVSAAVSAAENGAKVIALEKQEVPGGSSNFAEGLFAIGTEEQKKLFVDLTAAEAFKKSMEINRGFDVNPALVAAYIKESTQTIKWLKGHGVRFEVFRMSAEEPQTWHLIQDYKGAHHGAALITRMVEKAEELGVKIMYSTPGEKLIIENGIIKGVEAVDKRGNRVIIKAPAVIVATGGFGDSKEKIDKWTPYNSKEVEQIIPLGKTGDGIQMMVDAGAETVGLGLMLHPAIKDKHLPPMGDTLGMTWEPNLWVNKYGERVMDETIVHNFSIAGHVIEAQRDAYIWSVFDENTVKLLETEGSRTGLGVLIPVKTKFTKLRDEIKNAVAAGSKKVAYANTIEGLAKKIGVDVKKFKASVTQYNSIHENNKDEMFFRNPETVIPINNPTYYAIRVEPAFFTTLGGASVNTTFQVEDDNDNIIKGLYAAGCDVGGQYGRTYTLWASGSAFSFAATSGRISGKDAAEYAKKHK